MLAVSTALQMSLRAQQRYVSLAARGDDLLNRRETTDDAPPWATFDPPVAVADPEPVVDAPGTPRAPRAPRKAVRRPRNAKPSAFDVIGDE